MKLELVFNGMLAALLFSATCNAQTVAAQIMANQSNSLRIESAPKEQVKLAQRSTKINSGSEKASAFIKALTELQFKKCVFPFDEMSRYEWHYVPPPMIFRTGIAVKELEERQETLFYEMLKIYLSAEGYKRTQDIMSFEYLLKEMEPTNENRIPENYFISIYGTPNKDSTWAWKFTGHHLTLNFTIVKDELEFAPFFFGVYPSEVKSGEKKGLRLIKDEEDLGFELILSLTTEQKQKAIFQHNAFLDIVTKNSAQVAPLLPVGVLASDLKMEQKAILNKILVAYLLSMPTANRIARMKNVLTEDMNFIRFGWAGETEPGKPHYYRIQGKTFLIEFDNTQNNANHIHTVWRDFNDDYGRDLLKEHYQNSPHHRH